MKKKVVALLTLAMFVMTLLPVAAFAAPASATNSSVTVKDGYDAVDVNEPVALDVKINDADDNAGDQMKDVSLWVTADGTIVDTETWYGTNDGTAEGTETWKVAGTVTGASLVDDEKVFVKFSKPGTYVIHAAKGSVEDGIEFPVAEEDVTVVVTGFAQDSMTFVNTSNGAGNLPVNDKVVTLADLGDFQFNGVNKYVVTGTLKDENGKAMKDVTVNLSSNKDALELTKDSVTTDRNGAFKIEFTMSEKTNASVTISTDELEYTLKVLGADSQAENITTTVEDGYVLAGNDKNWTDADRNFTDAVQFEVTDKNGDVVTGELKDEPAYMDQYPAGYQHADFIDVDAPAKSKLTAADLCLVWDETDEVYTLRYNGSKDTVAKKLVAGEYTVKVALKSGDNATATFNVAKFGDVKDLAIKTYRVNRNMEAIDEIIETDDEIALGDILLVEVKYVDENGIEIKATNNDIKVGAEGKAIYKKVPPFDLEFAAGYFLREDSTVNESLIGTTIKVTAFDSKEKKLVTKELTVVDAYNTYGLAFDNKEGKVNVDNNVKVSVVDKNNKVAETVKGDVYAYVDSQSNKDAKVTVETVDEAYKGKFNIKVYANQPTTADIVVGVRTSDAEIYAGTLTYTFGEESIPAGTSVVMTLGSTEMIVNNQLVDMKDAAPFAQDNRTFVPFRALGEALGATVDYDQTAKTVTYKLGSSEIVMTLGSKDYTVNGVKKTMDVAPFAKDNRTYVPVRFVGEGLGFTVTGLTNANGQYVAVAFTK